MVFEHQNYQAFLKSVLVEKGEAKGKYSLRAFAQKIGVSVSFLSEVLNGKKSLSMEAAFKIAVKLDLTDNEVQYFCLLVQLEQEKDAGFREVLVKRLSAINPKRDAHDLSVDLFKTISDWYHFAILELSYFPDFRLEPDYISARLDITKTEAELAIERLKRLELVEKCAKTGRYKKSQGYMITESHVPNGALKIFHKQMLEKAIASIDEQTPKERMSATDVVPLDSKYLPEVDRLSREFSAAVLRLAEKSRVKDSVYSLAVHFFNLTPTKKEKQK